jgi:light-regulated signal transduction histidine kinase (bacteriophytochrome)
VRELEAALETARRELAALEFAVSHDLRAPLRAVDGFSAVLLRDYADGIPPEAAEYVGFVREGAQQLVRMVDALLLLSRLGRRSPTLATLDVVAEHPDGRVEAGRGASPYSPSRPRNASAASRPGRR